MKSIRVVFNSRSLRDEEGNYRWSHERQSINTSQFANVDVYANGQEFWEVDCRYCRDLFADKFHRDTEYILYGCGYKKANKFIQFIAWAEKLLKIKRSTIYPTQRSNVVLIQVSPFWRQSSMRRSFFTALLRCSVVLRPNTRPKNFKKVLYSCKYFAKTKIAVRRFLSRHTHYRGANWGWGGWVDAFEGRTSKTVNSLLK